MAVDERKERRDLDGHARVVGLDGRQLSSLEGVAILLVAATQIHLWDEHHSQVLGEFGQGDGTHRVGLEPRHDGQKLRAAVVRLDESQQSLSAFETLQTRLHGDAR